MKRLFGLMLVVATITISSGCSNKTQVGKPLNKEGVAPYELSESDTYLLESLGLEGNTNIISFKAPKGAKGLNAEVHVLEDDRTWNAVGGGFGTILLGEQANRLEGTFSMLLKDDYSVDMHFITLGRASIQSRPLEIDYEITSSFKTSVISVSIKPGAIAFTLIPLLANSCAIDFVKPIRPAFEAE